MKTLPALSALAVLAGVSALVADTKPETETKTAPLKALLITGGCCHDYDKQKIIIPAGISERANVEWTVIHEGGKSRDHQVSVYSEEGWADDFDVVVHNECFGAVEDVAFVESIAKVHAEGKPGVTLHCSTHSYRAAKTDEWRKCLGVSSFNHGKHAPITMTPIEAEHPVVKGFPESWTTPQGELYNIEKVWEGCTPLIMGEASGRENVCVWVNEYGEGKVFGTTVGHHNETMAEDVYLDLVTRGLLWACGKLDDEGKPLPGYGAED